jgi:mycothiol synthase
MPIHVRPYTDDDLPRLQAALASWIAEAGGCGYYHVGNLPHWIYETLRGRPVGELVRVWQEGEQIIGVSISGLFDAAFQVFASPPHRGGEAETAMLELAAETTGRVARSSAPGETSVGTDVFGCDSTRQRLLEQLGFARYRVWDHIAERGLGGALPHTPLPPGFRIRPATLDDYGQLAQARNETFGGGWAPEEYRDSVMRKPGYWPERELVAVAPDGRVAAFTVIRLDDTNKVGQFEPVGTVPAFHRRGLARALMAHALADMRRRGMATATVSYDATNLPAAALYGSLGFAVRYETLGYRRA